MAQEFEIALGIQMNPENIFVVAKAIRDYIPYRPLSQAILYLSA